MTKLNCTLKCNRGYWSVILPFNAGVIDLGSEFDDLIDLSEELKVINHLENGLSPEDMIEENVYWKIDTIKDFINKLGGQKVTTKPSV